MKGKTEPDNNLQSQDDAVPVGPLCQVRHMLLGNRQLGDIVNMLAHIGRIAVQPVAQKVIPLLDQVLVVRRDSTPPRDGG